MPAARPINDPSDPPRILFAGGASGGHILPAVAVAQEIVDRHADAQILFVTSDKPLDTRILEAYPYEQITQHAPKVPTGLTGWLSFPFRFVLALKNAVQVVKHFRPDVVVGTGAYVSVPTVLAAKLLQIPIVLMEPNYAPGRATRLLARFARRIVCSHKATALALRPWPVETLGTPVRKEIEAASRTDAYAHFQLDPHHKTLLILGGSQGSTGVNRMVTDALPRLFSNGLALNIIHQTGVRDLQKVKEQYRKLNLTAHVLPFIEKIDMALAAADIAVSRAGAITIAEMAARNIPSILVPLPHAVEDDQRRNAKHMAANGAAHLIDEGDTAAGLLANRLHDLLENPAQLQEMAAQLDGMAQLNARVQIAEVVVGQIGDVRTKTEQIIPRAVLP